MIQAFRHVCVLVKDLDRSIRFYRDLLGLRVSGVINIDGGQAQKLLGVKNVKLRYVKLWAPDQAEGSEPVFELHNWINPRLVPKKTMNHVSFTVQDLDKEYDRLSRLGVKFIAKPLISPSGKTKISFGYDPDNNLIEFMQDLV